MNDSIQTDRRKQPRGLFFGWFTCIACLVLAAASSPAQKPDDIIRVDTELVTFEVNVTDSDGRPVRNLSLDDFQVFEDGVERKPDFFEAVSKSDAGRPMSIVLALDVSGSMTGPEMERLKAALASFAAKLADYNSYFAVTSFAMEVSTVQSFTNRRDKLQSSIIRLKRDQDGLSTHAYDAVDHAIRLLRTKGPRYSMNRLTKRAVVLITDGFPVGDTVAPDTVIERANLAETSVYALILPSYSRFQVTKRPLLTPLEASGIIDRTGGRSFYATSNNFEPLFKALEDEITGTYAIAFYPDKNNGTRNEFRNVRIISRKGYAVKQNRVGYKPHQ
ncbi:MAG: VWA domain-containing protein [Acidobacteria bacterium]|nr:VWA domain-containing protein [Acidobacteriota bacterium]